MTDYLEVKRTYKMCSGNLSELNEEFKRLKAKLETENYFLTDFAVYSDVWKKYTIEATFRITNWTENENN